MRARQEWLCPALCNGEKKSSFKPEFGPDDKSDRQSLGRITGLSEIKPKNLHFSGMPTTRPLNLHS
jgi:hypothetical protein